MALRIGFLGAGLIANAHARLLGQAGGAALSAVFDLDPERTDAFAALTGAHRCGSDEEVLDRCDAVYICTWTSAHGPLVAEAARRGLPVFCEKPLATDVDRARAMVETVEAAGIVNQVGLVLRYSPAFFWLRHLLDDPESGRLLSITFRDDQYLPIGGYYASTWRADVDKVGAGVLLEHSIHDLDMIEHLAGPITDVSCRTMSVHALPGVEDVATYSFRCASGVSGVLNTVWHDMLDRGNERRVELLCDRLWCALDGNHHHGPVSWQRPGEPVRTLGGEGLARAAADAGLTQQNEDAAFVDAIAGGAPAFPDFRVGLRAHLLVDAGYRSAAQDGTVVEITTPWAPDEVAGWAGD